ncbi:NADH:flavin oxidoreductase [Oceanobacillus sp. FSL K6-2867]|uniref:NADH:flavin oxidoreductase n=1 Tax=Oceanobacillus sp. FSL K6-2867 TaxID=2954748 RepID=UPI0030D79E74
MSDVKSLFETAFLGSTTLDNRVGVAPMTRISATAEGLATNQMRAYYTSFARGGFSLIITEGIYTDDKSSPGYIYQPGIINKEQTEAWRKVVDSVHQAGTKIVAQIMHTGALVHGNPFGHASIGPSAVQPKGEKSETYEGTGPYPMPKEATKEEITEVITGFVNAAKRTQAAGFDGIEIHGANGYLLDEFLTDYTNQRTDEYGGSTENRVRLLVEVSKAIREAVGPDFTVGIRISQAKVNDQTHKWAGKEKDAEIIFGRLGQAGLDFIHVTEYEAWKPAFDTGGLSLAALAKKYGKLPVIANGHLENPEKANKIIANGEADVVTLGKGALANHEWVTKVKNGKALATFNPEEVLKPNAKIKAFEV